MAANTETSRAGSSRAVGPELTITRTYDAPVSLVFQIWSEREHMQQWLGPRGFTCTSLSLDFRPGGAWRGCIQSEQYGALWMGGVYREIVPDRRLVFTFAWDEGPDEPGLQTLVTVTFSERDGKTIQTFHQAPFVDEASRDSHIGGWNECFDKQQQYTERLALRGARA
jgi:uncharacterized protein YndB with AHSA1/START domain